jgi:hypothetical protein
MAIEKIAQKFKQLLWEPEYNLFEEEDSETLLSENITDEECIKKFKEDEKAEEEIDFWIEKNEHNSSDEWIECHYKINPTVDSDGEYTGGF